MTELDKKFKNWLINILRRASYRWPPRGEALKLSRVDRGLYRCAMCQQTFSRKDIQLDHIIPVVDVEGFKDWNTFISRLFVPIEGWATLCIACHDNKTLTEGNVRKKRRKKEKKTLTKKDPPDTLES